MHESLTNVNDSTVSGLGRLARFFGFSDVMGRLYGTLLLAPGPLSLDDLAAGLQISKGSVSMNMRALERWGMAKEVWVRGERKKYYSAEPDFWKVIRNVLAGREMREVQAALRVLGESIGELQASEGGLVGEERELARFYLQRMEDLQAFFQFSQMVLETFVGGQEPLDFNAIARIDINNDDD